MQTLGLPIYWLLVASGLGAWQEQVAPRTAVRLVEVSGAVKVDLMRELFETGMEQSAGPLPSYVKDKVWQEFRDSFPRDEAVERLASIYEELFSEEELEDLVVFYESPLGQSLTRVQGDLSTRTVLAVQELSGVTAQRVGSKLLYYFEGENFRASGHLEEAVESFRRAVTLYPEDPEFRESLGRTLAAVGRLDESRAEYEALMRLRPEVASDSSGLPFVQPVSLEPEFKRTFRPLGEIPQGTVFNVRVLDRVDDHAIHVHRCVEPCDTATMVKVWEPGAYREGETLRWQVDVDGSYYLWVRDTSEESAVAGVTEEVVENRTRIVLESGAALEVWYVTPW